MLNAHRAILGSEESIKILLLKESADNLEKILANSVNSGIVKELEDPSKKPLTLEKEIPIS